MMKKKKINAENPEAVSPEEKGSAEEKAENTSPPELKGEEVSNDIPYKTFATEEEYKADRQKFFDEHIGNRLKESRENAQLLEKIKEQASKLYGDENSLDKLLSDLENKSTEDTEPKSEVISRWESEGEKLKESVPGFDFEKALNNPRFRELIINGSSVEGAYYAVKYQETLDANPASRQRMVQNAQMKGTKHGSGVNAAMAMSDSEFRKYINNILSKN